MRFIEYRQPPEQMKETEREVADRAALIAHCKQLLYAWPTFDHVQDDDFLVSEYGQEWWDPNLGEARPWITHIVTIRGYGVIGFTDCVC